MHRRATEQDRRDQWEEDRCRWVNSRLRDPKLKRPQGQRAADRARRNQGLTDYKCRSSASIPDGEHIQRTTPFSGASSR